MNRFNLKSLVLSLILVSSLSLALAAESPEIKSSQPAVTVTRELPETVKAGQVIDVGLNVDVDESQAKPAGVIIAEEYDPQLKLISASASSKGASTVKWVLINLPNFPAVEDQTITYQLRAPSQPGSYHVDGEVKVVDSQEETATNVAAVAGNSKITVEADQSTVGDKTSGLTSLFLASEVAIPTLLVALLVVTAFVLKGNLWTKD